MGLLNTSNEDWAKLAELKAAGLDEAGIRSLAGSRGTGAIQDEINARLGTTTNTLSNGMVITSTNQPETRIDPYAPDAYRAPLGAPQGLLEAPVSTQPQPGATPQELVANGSQEQQWAPEWTPQWQPRTPENRQLQSDLKSLQGVDPTALQNYTSFRDYQGPGGSNTAADEIAQNFYTSVKNTEGAYENLTSPEKMQYQYLRYVNDEISGNNKDDQIKKIWQSDPNLGKEYIDDKGNRSIWRNKPLEAERKNGITAGDAFSIGQQNQRDTGKDDGLLEQVINKSLPGFDLTDVLDAGGAPLALASNLAAPFTSGLSAAAYQTLAAAEGRQGWDDALGNTIIASAPVIGNAQDLLSPILGTGAAVTGGNLIKGESVGDSLKSGLTNVGVNVGTNLLLDGLQGSPTSETLKQVLPENIANQLGVYTDAANDALADLFSVGGDSLDNVHDWLRGAIKTGPNGETVPGAPDWLAEPYRALTKAGKDLLSTEMAKAAGRGALDAATVIAGIIAPNRQGAGNNLSQNDVFLLGGAIENQRDKQRAVKETIDEPLLGGSPEVVEDVPTTPLIGGTPVPVVDNVPADQPNEPLVGGDTPVPPSGGGQTPATSEPPPAPVPDPGTPYYFPQDMSTRYEKPQYADVQQNAPFEPYQPKLLAPMVTPAGNSGQASFEEWLQNYMEQGGTPQGLLAMISGNTGQGSGLI